VFQNVMLSDLEIQWICAFCVSPGINVDRTGHMAQVAHDLQHPEYWSHSFESNSRHEYPDFCVLCCVVLCFVGKNPCDGH